MLGREASARWGASRLAALSLASVMLLGAGLPAVLSGGRDAASGANSGGTVIEPSPEPTPGTALPAEAPRVNGVVLLESLPPDAPLEVAELGEVQLSEPAPHAEDLQLPRPADLTGLDALVEPFLRVQRSYVRLTAGSGESALTVRFAALATAGDYLVLELSAVSQTRQWPQGRAVSQTMYLDVQRDTAFDGGQLFSDAGRDALLQSLWVVAAGQGFSGPDAASQTHPVTPLTGDLLADTRITAQGALQVKVAAGLLAPVTRGQLTFEVPADQARPLLSVEGQGVYDAVTVDVAFTGLPLPPPPDCTVLKCLALTFDDGPSISTPEVLDVLAQHRVPATFFVLGQQVAGREDLLLRMIAEGHEIGGHSWNHKDLRRLKYADVMSQIRRTEAAITAVTGQPVVWERPPYGGANAKVLQAMGDAGRSVVMWNIDSEDWKNRDVAATTALAVNTARPNGILLFHDIRPTTAQALPAILTQLEAQGYTFVTLSEVLTPQPGAVFYSLD